MDRNARRRAMAAATQRAQLDQQFRETLTRETAASFQRGLDAGRREGSRGMRTQILDQAARLFAEGRDDDATIVREVHRMLSQAAGETLTNAAEEKKA